MTNFIPHETKIFNDRDPPWINNKVKTMIKKKKNIFHDNIFVTDFSKKADLFNSFFAKQCSIIENNSILPLSTIPVTDQYLANIYFTKDDIKRIISKLDPNKAHGHMISIRMENVR